MKIKISGLQAIVLLIFIFNIGLLLTTFTRLTWDAETHMFFADHYAIDWFNPWEDRWMTGFWVWGYPPLAHQLIALGSFVMEMDWSYRVVQLGSLVSFPLSMYWFVRPLVSKQETLFVTALAIFVPGIYVMLYAFGQITTFLGLILALTAAGWYLRYLLTGRPRYLIGLTVSVAATMTAHHYTVVTTVPLLLSTLTVVMLLKYRSKLRTFVPRVLMAAFVVFCVAAISILPFWWWYFNENLPQLEIPHTTRRFFFDNAQETELFFLGQYGVLLVLFPVSLLTLKRSKCYLVPLFALTVFLGVLGLGTMTGLPKYLFAYADTWKWLTYERFSAWAAVLSVIPVGMMLSKMMKEKRYLILLLIFSVSVTVAAREATFTQSHSVQPIPLQKWEEEAIVKFLEEDEHNEWRYVTFGLGESGMARISRLTDSKNLDGAYYTGRIPTLFRDSGIGVLDAALWWEEPGYKTIFPILQNPEKWNLKWAVVGEPWIEIHLKASGWELIHPLGKNIGFDPLEAQPSRVRLWKVPDTHFVPKLEQILTPEYPRYLSVMWGIVPVLSLIATLLCFIMGRSLVTPSR